MTSQRFTPHDLAEVLRDLFRAESTGCLTLTGDAAEQVRIYTVYGLIDMAMERGPHATFLQGLADEGNLPSPLPPELGNDVPPPDRLHAALGKAASRAGIIDRIHRETEQAVQAAFALPGGVWTFSEEALEPRFDPDVPRTLQALLAGIAGIERWAPVRRILSSQKRVLKPCTVPLFPVECLPLQPEEGYLLSRMDGVSTFADLAMLLPSADPDMITKFVYSALVLGFVELEPSLVEPFALGRYAEEGREQRQREEKEIQKIDDFYGNMIGNNPYRTIGVTDGASWNEIKQAYERAKKAFHPDRFLDSVVLMRRRELRIIETALVESYLKIQSLRMDAAGERTRDRDDLTTIEDITGKRKESVKTERQTALEQNEKRAQEYHARAREYYAQGDYHNAIQYCRLSIRHCDTLAESHALLGEALSRNPAHRWQLQAEACLKRALQLDPWNARLFLKTAEFYRRKGMTQRAERLEAKAYEISPSLRTEKPRDAV